ncbi:MAG: ABC transporter substrate-binding protein [Microthrixaceae bacterium]
MFGASVLLLSACTKVEDTASAEDGAAGAEANQDASTTTLLPIEDIPEGTTLRVGDQLGVLEIPLTISGSGDGTPYTIEYSNFLGGPLMLEAFNAGAIDVGFVADTPPVLAQAQGLDVVIVAAWENTGNQMAIVVPEGSDIESVDDLVGHDLAYQKGTVAQAFALQAFEEAEVDPGDVEPVDLSIVDIPNALSSGNLDAGVITEPMLSLFLSQNPGARIVRDSGGLSTGLTYLIASRDSLSDPVRASVIGDYLGRLLDGLHFVNENSDSWVDAYYKGKISVPEDIATKLSAKLGAWSFPELAAPVFEQQQAIAGLFFEAGVIPNELDAREEFDTRYNPLIAAKNEELGTSAG